MKTILITGGAGFIGNNLVRLLLKDKETVVVNLDKLTYAGSLASLADILDDFHHIFVKGSINNRILVSRLLAKYQPDYIIHLAAESHVDRSIATPEAFIQANIVGTFALLEAVREYWNGLTPDSKAEFRFLHVSTDEVYGSLGADGQFTENSQYAPNSPYSASKAAADHLVRAYGRTYGLPVLITHCSNNYGPYQFPEKLIPLMIKTAVAGKLLPVYGNGSNIRDWLYVLDHCNALRTILDKGTCSENYNIGGNSEMTNLEVVNSLCAVLDELAPRPDKQSYRRQIVFIQDRPGHDLRYAIDASKLRLQLGWQPTEKFITGIRKTVKWYLDHPHWGNQESSSMSAHSAHAGNGGIE